MLARESRRGPEAAETVRESYGMPWSAASARRMRRHRMCVAA